jgi:hypothetical protein
MREDEQLSSLIGDIYDAALDTTQWIPVLGRVCEFVGGCSVTLFAKDAVKKNGNIFYEEGKIESQSTKLCLDPSTTGQFFVEVRGGHRRFYCS